MCAFKPHSRKLVAFYRHLSLTTVCRTSNRDKSYRRKTLWYPLS